MSNIKFILERAQPGFAEKIQQGEKFRTIVGHAKRLGMECLKYPGAKNCHIISNGARSFVFYGAEVYVKHQKHSRHNDKHDTKEMLRKIGVPVPAGAHINPGQESDLSSYYKKNGMPKCVLKPVDMNKGSGVFVGISSEDELLSAYATISNHRCIVEELIPGDEHRLLVVGGRVVAVVKRVPANVVGDGTLTIEELVNAKNDKRKSIRFHSDNLIVVDEQAVEYLSSQGLGLSSVLEEGAVAYLRKVSNVSMGGDSIDVTEEVDQGFIDIAEKVWLAFPDRAVYAVDLMCEDIASSPSGQKHAVIEVNNRPMLAGLHGYPIHGPGRQVGKKIIEYVFG
ncbi:MAG: ATP-grasp domain-containing protein [Halomonas sp.]|nr:ATP-grasp domain-containing protein [Halomonas sp.]MCC5904083.1 ATP-grasp domain-containing protein [Halomonas sp.]